MFNNIEAVLKNLFNCLQANKMYGQAHPMFIKSLDKAYDDFTAAFVDRQDIVIGIVEEELVFEKEILFDLGKFMQPIILYLKERNIERLSFSRGLSKEELHKFINFIAEAKENFKGDLGAKLSYLNIKNISLGKLKIADQKDDSVSIDDQANLYDSSANQVNQALNEVLNSKKVDQLLLKFSLNNLMDNLGSAHYELLKLATLRRYDAETYTHMLNVSILAMFFSSRLGFDKDDVLSIGVAALFHDIGKLYVSRKTLHKAEQLTDQEFGSIKSHTVLGAEIMFGYIDALGILPVIIAFEHHLKYDSSGYPRLPLLKKQHIASAIVSICDVYDALSQRRGYKQDYSPDVVYNIMNKGKGSSFDPQLLDQFFRFIGFWPVGSVVALNDKSIALVKDQNESDIRRPKIEIVSPSDKKRPVDLAQDNSLSIQRYLNPWKEGREFLNLI